MLRKLTFLVLTLFTFSFAAHAEEESKRPVRVYVDIVGDLLHMGHIEFFKQAKAFGDYLIVGVHSDEDVASYKRTPILTMQERISMVEACRYVDEVFAYAPLGVSEAWLKEHQIDIVVHGDDFKGDLLNGQYGDPIRMGIFRSVPYTKGISTTDIINRIKTRFAD